MIATYRQLKASTNHGTNINGRIPNQNSAIIKKSAHQQNAVQFRLIQNASNPDNSQETQKIKFKLKTPGQAKKCEREKDFT